MEQILASISIDFLHLNTDPSSYCRKTTVYVEILRIAPLVVVKNILSLELYNKRAALGALPLQAALRLSHSVGGPPRI